MNIRSPLAVPTLLLVVLNLIWYGLALVLVLTLIAMTAGAGLAVQFGPDGEPHVDIAGSRVTIPVSFALVYQPEGAPAAVPLPVISSSLGIEDARVTEARGSLEFVPRQNTVLANVAAAGLLILGLWMVGQLRGLIRSVRAGTPFAAANAGRVRRLAYAVLIAELGRWAIVFWGNQYAAAHFSSYGLAFASRPEFHPLAIVNGLILLAIAEVFRGGTRAETSPVS